LPLTDSIFYNISTKRFIIFRGLAAFMTLYFIGLGLSDERDISVKGLEAVKGCERIYLEHYTSRLNCSKEELEKLYGRGIILADRELVEQRAEETILKDSKTKETAFLVVGDIFSATTHMDLWLRARELGIKTRFIHNAGVFSGISETGLQLYKFGKTTSIPFPTEKWKPESPYEVIKQNLEMGAHTLVLLDLSPKDSRFMTVNEAIRYLLEIEEKRGEGVFTKNTFCVGCARLGSEEEVIRSGKAQRLSKTEFGKPLHCLIVPSKLHFLEEKALNAWEKA
jgi:diphthine synthase